MSKEIWHRCEVPYTRYEVSNLGRVRNAHTGRILKPLTRRGSYLHVDLCYKGEIKHKSIHILVATAFVPGWREGLEVNHKDGNKKNNCAENLEWVTHSENHRHSRDVLLVDVKPVALLDERGHLQRIYHSAQACNRAWRGCVHRHIKAGCRFRGFKPFYISVAMYREIVHLVNVHHYTLHGAWVESLTPGPSPKGEGSHEGGFKWFNAPRRGSNGSNVGADSLPQPLRKKGSKTVCPNNTQPAAQTGKGNQNYQLSARPEGALSERSGERTINYQLSDEA